jgi:hypothetical protein
MLDEQIAHKNEMKKVLTAEQYEKWEKMSKNKMKKGMQKMKNAQRTEK